MASNPPSPCCTVGVKHEGEPTGKIETIDGNEIYITTPHADKAHADMAVLIVTDVMGHCFPNAQLIADQFAANGYLTAMPDVFFGDALPLNRAPDFDFFGWLNGKDGKKAHNVENTEPYVKSAVKYLRETRGVKRIGAVGYCFGAKYVIRGLGDGSVDVGYAAHPSFVEEDELKCIQGPMSIAAAEIDHIFPPEKRHKSEVILAETKQPWQLNLYSGCEHGFAVRAELSNKEKKFGKEQAFCQAVIWLDTWLKG